MEQGNKNKMMSGENVKNKATKAGNLEDYNFPEHGITIQASSIEEAQEKLEIYLKSIKKEK